MKIQIKPGFLFPIQFWTAELNENIKQLQNEAYLIRKRIKMVYVKVILVLRAIIQKILEI